MKTGGKYKNICVTHIGTIRAGGNQIADLIYITGALGLVFK
jgi:hypothetical protein